MNNLFRNERILVTGGTGSIGHALIKEIVTEAYGPPKKLWVFSRGENKQYEMRKEFPQSYIDFMPGDIRNFDSICNALTNIDIVFHLAAMKHVPASELNPIEAVMTNIIGSENIIRSIKQHRLPVKRVVGVSTDKACCPVSVMGMTKSIQERIFAQANGHDTAYISCRFGNVAGTRGSVIPLWKEQALRGGPLTVTHPHMSRFFMTPKQAAELLIEACAWGNTGEIWVPCMMSCFMIDLARVIAHGKDIVYSGIRPGERLHEVIISQEESRRARKVDIRHYVIDGTDRQNSEPPWEYRSNDPAQLGRSDDIKQLLYSAGIL